MTHETLPNFNEAEIKQGIHDLEMFASLNNLLQQESTEDVPFDIRMGTTTKTTRTENPEDNDS